MPIRIEGQVAATLSALVGCVVLTGSSLTGQAPPDRPLDLDSAAVLCVRRATAALTDRAQATLPGVVRRFQSGLPGDQEFSVTIRLYDNRGREEQVFVVIHEMRGDTLVGVLASDIRLVHGFAAGMGVLVLPAAVLDWTILHADGTEEGNLIGKWVDSIQDVMTRKPATHLCDLVAA